MQLNAYTEEVLLGILRNSKQIKILNIAESKNEHGKKMVLELQIDNKFGVTLINPLNETFANFSEGNK